MDVAVDVEVRVTDPDRVIELQRDLAQLPREGGDVADAVVDLGLHGVEGVAVGHRGRVEDDQAAHVHELLGGLEVEEARVESGQSIHGRILSATGTRSIFCVFSTSISAVSFLRRQLVTAALPANAILLFLCFLPVVTSFLAGCLSVELAPRLLAVPTADAAANALSSRWRDRAGLALVGAASVCLTSLVAESRRVQHHAVVVL